MFYEKLHVHLPLYPRVSYHSTTSRVSVVFSQEQFRITSVGCDSYIPPMM